MRPVATTQVSPGEGFDVNVSLNFLCFSWQTQRFRVSGKVTLRLDGGGGGGGWLLDPCVDIGVPLFRTKISLNTYPV